MRRTLDLRTGRPVWMAYRARTVPCARLSRDARTEVLVVGMGISGAMAAESLTAAGFRVMMIDARGPMLGSTPASTALVQYEIDVPLTRLTRMIGRERAEQAWRRSRLAVANLGARVKTLEISCAMVERDSLLLGGTDLGAGGLRTEAAARRAAGLSAEYLTRSALRERYGIERVAAIESPGNLALDPRRLTSGLIRCAIARGARCFAPTTASAFASHRAGVDIATAEGPVISAEYVVLATGYELLEGVPSDTHAVISTWAIATRPQPRALWPGRALIWESADPYLYVRATSDGRIICGGEDEHFSDEAARDVLIPTKAARLSAKLARLFPLVDARPAFSWAGAFGTTKTGLPLIGRLPDHPRVHAILGYGGNGITFSRIAAELVCTALTGAVDADAALFAFKH